ncbi:MAG TPA: hypothetical protein EYQ42_02620 [Thiotrichaceae bacterium]|jgi:phosphatidylinositol glycan class B|nr:hypothetical protein [Thiotrichaceae bacterium]HIM08093.1 hypothetical protein [Gammaproteobacteria bacterium]
MRVIPKNWLIFAVFIYLLAAWSSVGHYHDDEYYQILDFTALKLGFEMQNAVMWEYEAGVRSGLQPLIAFLVVKAMMSIDITSPFLWAFCLRLISLMVSLVSIIVFIQAIKDQIKSDTIFRWTVFFLLYSWLFIFLNVRFSSESWALSLFILAYGIYFSQDSLNDKKCFYVGLVLGFAFLARYQMGFLLLGFVCWMLFQRHEKLRNLLIIVTGGVTALILGVAIDYWLYGTFTLSGWNYFEWHILKGSLDNIVHEPWWYYSYYSAVQLIPPITLLLPIVVLIFWMLFPRHPITWSVLPFVLFHHYFGHKEMRYLFPVLPFAPVMFAMVLEKLIYRFRFLETNKFIYPWKIIIGVSVFLNTILIVLVLTLPASKEVALWQNCLSRNLSVDTSVLLVYDPDGSSSSTGELELDFYNKDNIPVISVSNESEIADKIIELPDKQLFYASRKKNREKDLSAAEISHKLVCQALPNWLLKININDWTSRTSMWRIWSVK